MKGAAKSSSESGWGINDQGRLIALLAVALCGIVLVAIVFLRPDPIEGTSVRYWAWKHGLVKMDLDRALDEMVNDPGRDSTVLGKTETELRAKFGFTLPVEQASSYVQYCYKNSEYAKDQVVMLRHSNWMVLMRESKAAQLIRVSGC
jgi:hypothetical protein